MEVMTLITFLFFDTPQETIAKCNGAIACAVVHGQACTVYATKPQLGYSQDMEVIGHEVMHCIAGGYHASEH